MSYHSYLAFISHTTLSIFFFYSYGDHRDLHSFPTRRSSDLVRERFFVWAHVCTILTFLCYLPYSKHLHIATAAVNVRSEEHTSELQSRRDLVCRLLLEKKKKRIKLCVNFVHDVIISL